LSPADDVPEGNMKPPPPRAQAVSVALKDDQDGRSPRVVAAGRGTVAEQILALAFANGIKVREDADLAELLSAIDIDSEIPLEAFTAVAEILRYVYLANGEIKPDDINREHE
jgi:flagellar biosynthesis protein